MGFVIKPICEDSGKDHYILQWTPVITKVDITKCIWSACYIILANDFGYNETPLVTKVNRGPVSFVITGVHCIFLNNFVPGRKWRYTSFDVQRLIIYTVNSRYNEALETSISGSFVITKVICLNNVTCRPKKLNFVISTFQI